MERLQTLISSACLEHLDFLDEDLSNLDFMTLKELETDNSQYKSLSDLPKLSYSDDEQEAKPEDFLKLNLNELICLLRQTTVHFTRALILHELIKRFGMTLQIQDVTIEEMFNQLNAEAASVQNWKTVRFCTSILHKTVDSLAPSITNILVRGKIITLGVFGEEEFDIVRIMNLSCLKIKIIIEYI
jgi:phosphorylase kinase alpha/beta subunit